MQSRIVDWLSEENLAKGVGKTRAEIFDEFGNTPEPIAYIPTQFLSLVDPNLSDQRIYCGKGYFIDHALRNHAQEGKQLSAEDVDVSKYLNIQTVLDNPDAIKETFVDGKRTVVFIKKIGRYFAELTQVEEDGKIILHKSTFNQKKEPYAKLNDIRHESSSSGGGASSISHADKSAPAISLESRGDDKSSDGKVNTLSADKQVTDSESSKKEYTDEELASMPKDDLGQLISDAEQEMAEIYDKEIEETQAEIETLRGKWRRTAAETRRMKQLEKSIEQLERDKKTAMLDASKRYRDIYMKRMRESTAGKSLQELMDEAGAEVEQNPTEAPRGFRRKPEAYNPGGFGRKLEAYDPSRGFRRKPEAYDPGGFRRKPEAYDPSRGFNSTAGASAFRGVGRLPRLSFVLRQDE